MIEGAHLRLPFSEEQLHALFHEFGVRDELKSDRCAVARP